MAESIVIDSDVLIEALRDTKEAVTCLKQIEQRATPLISIISAMKLVVGCRDKTELQVLDRFLTRFQVLEVNRQISDSALGLLHHYHLSHGLLIADALIAATAIEAKMAFLTKNVHDYRFITGLDLLPYPLPFGDATKTT